ncbi:hypothetical protein ACEQPO_05810 [Bacillus sp. SL00103]
MVIVGQKKYDIVGIQVGQTHHDLCNGKRNQNSINKSEYIEPVHLSKVNFDGDGQGDLVHHEMIKPSAFFHTITMPISSNF